MKGKGKKMEKKNKKKMLWKIFISTLYLSAFTFGGGYVIVTLMKNKYVDELNWIEEKEMLDLVAIGQSAPGPIAVNGAIVIGFKLAGIKGALVSIIATIIPPFVIISLVSLFYEAFKSNEIISLILFGMQAAIGAIIASVTYDMARGIVDEHEKALIIIMIIAFVLTYIYDISVVYIVIGCGLIGAIQSMIEYWRKR